MQPIKDKNHVLFSTSSLLIGFAGLLTVLAFDKFYWQNGILTEGWPDFSLPYVVRSLVILMSILAIVYSFPGWSKHQVILSEKSGMTFERWSVIAIMIVSLICLSLFLFNTSVFSTWSHEDSVVEWGSFAFLILASFVFVLIFIKTLNNKQIKPQTRWLFLLFVFAFFVMGMEEISWFQRELDIKTPEILLENNMQGELNLHNLATNKVEDAYYFLAFVFLVLLPYLRTIFPKLLRFEQTEILVPRPFIALAGAFACAYNFDMWNIIFIQISFLSAVIILFSYFHFLINRNDRIIAFAVLLIIIMSQICFIVNGKYFERIWEVTEYKELFIPIAFFIYSVDVFRTCLKKN